MILPLEKSLSLQIFGEYLGLRIFHEIVVPILENLLRFGKRTVKYTKSPEKIFFVLDSFEALRDLVPKVRPWEENWG